MTLDEAAGRIAGWADSGLVADPAACRAIAGLSRGLAAESACGRPQVVRDLRLTPGRLAADLGCDRRAYPGCRDCPRTASWPTDR